MWTWRNREDGQATAEYLGIVVVVALVIAALTAAVVLPGNGNVSQDLHAAVCRIHLAGCDDGGGATGGDGATDGGNAEAGSPGAPAAPGQAQGPGQGQAPGQSGPAGQDTGCQGFWGCAWNGVEQVGSGIYNIGKGAVDDVTGLIDLIADPGKIVDAGKYIWDHPWDAAKQLVWDDESSQMWDNGDYGGSIGRTIWNVGSWFIPFYDVGKAGSKLGKLGELGKLGNAADKVADLSRLADDAARLAREAETAAARGDLAAAEKAARQARADAEAAKARARKVGCPIAIGLIPGQRSSAGLVLATAGGGGVGHLGAAVPVVMSPAGAAGPARAAGPPRAAGEGCDEAAEAARKAEEEAAAAEKAAADAALNNGLGPLVPVKVNDPAAAKLAERLNGQPSVKFANGPDNEFDTVSDLYVAQSKPANFTLNKSFRDQAKVTFETAVKTGRTPYFHFEGPPRPGVLEALQRYADRYGVEPVIDTVPLGGP